MDLPRIKALIDIVASSGIAELEITEGGETIRIIGAAGAAPPRPAPAAALASLALEKAEPEPPADDGGKTGERVITAPLHGVFHLRPAPDSPPFVVLGQTVSRGDKLCIIEAMKVFNTIEAEAPGRIAAILAESGAEVEFGQPLFRLE